MSKVLEALIARGRRVRRPREQREVAFGLAELSTHPEIHVKFLKKGGLKTLLHLLQVQANAAIGPGRLLLMLYLFMGFLYGSDFVDALGHCGLSVGFSR